MMENINEYESQEQNTETNVFESQNSQDWSYDSQSFGISSQGSSEIFSALLNSPVQQAVLPTPLSKALCMCMVYCNEPRSHQEHRDTLRLASMEENGFKVYSWDDKHLEIESRSYRVGWKIQERQTTREKHINADFGILRRVRSALETKFPTGMLFDVIIFDFYYVPAGSSNI